MVDMTTGITRYVNTLPIDPYISIISGKNQDYGNKVSQMSGFGNGALITFGKLGNDNAKITLGGTQYDAVASPIEFYYTDMVFLKGQYERALISLYRNLAEMPEKRSEVNEAIGLVKDIAKRRGVNVNENNAKSIYRQEITAEILGAGSTYFGAGKCNGQCQTIIDYYLNPSDANFNKVVGTAKTLINRDNNLFSAYMNTLTTLSLDFRSKVSARL